MPMFRVELERRIFGPNERPRNPFFAGLPPENATHEISVRSWEFEAKDETEVRALLAEARVHDIGTVRGYRLRSIQKLPDQTTCDSK